MSKSKDKKAKSKKKSKSKTAKAAKPESVTDSKTLLPASPNFGN